MFNNKITIIAIVLIIITGTASLAYFQPWSGGDEGWDSNSFSLNPFEQKPKTLLEKYRNENQSDEWYIEEIGKLQTGEDFWNEKLSDSYTVEKYQGGWILKNNEDDRTDWTIRPTRFVAETTKDLYWQMLFLETEDLLAQAFDGDKIIDVKEDVKEGIEDAELQFPSKQQSELFRKIRVN